jgi:hypothetical protein
MTEGAVLHQAESRGELGLVQSRFQTADGIGLAHRHRQAEDALGQFLNLRDPRAPAAEEDAGAQDKAPGRPG